MHNIVETEDEILRAMVDASTRSVLFEENLNPFVFVLDHKLVQVKLPKTE